MGNLKARAALAAVMCGILAVPSTAQAQSSVGTTLVDVAPEDTFYQMLASLGDELGCFDGTIKLDGRRTLTRFEFAAILNSCVDNLSRRISTSDFAISDADQLTIGTLQQEFASELTVLGARGSGLSTEEQAASDARANDFSSNRRNVRISVEPFATSVDVATINGNGRREFAGQFQSNLFGTLSGDSGITYGQRIRVEGGGSPASAALLGLTNDGPNDPQMSVFLEASTFSYNDSFTVAAAPSFGNDLALLSPQGPGGVAGGGVFVMDGGVGFADVINAQEEVSGRRSRIEVGTIVRFQGDFSGISLPLGQEDGSIKESLPRISDPVGFGAAAFAITAEAGFFAEFDSANYSSSGQTGLFGGAPAVNFATSFNLDQSTFGVFVGAGFQAPLATLDSGQGLQFGLLGDAQVGVGWYNRSASANLTTMGAANVNETATFNDTGFMFDGSAQGGIYIGNDDFQISVQGGVDISPTYQLELSPFAPGRLSSGQEANIVGSLKTTFSF